MYAFGRKTIATLLLLGLPSGLLAQESPCNVLSQIPDQLYLYYTGTFNPITYFEFDNDCDYPVSIYVNQTADQIPMKWIGTPMWVGQHSSNRLQFFCPEAGIVELITITTSNGEVAVTEAVCIPAVVRLDAPASIPISDVPGEELRVQGLVTAQDEEYSGVDVLLTMRPNQTYHVWNETYSAIPAACDGLGAEMFLDGWRGAIHDWKCGLWNHLPRSSDKKHCRGPTTIPTQPPTEAPSTAGVCCQSITDIREDPSYETLDFSDLDCLEVSLPFWFRLVDGTYFSYIYVCTEGLVMWNSGGPPPSFPATTAEMLWAGYWQNYTGYTEVGMVISETECTIQWTDLELEGSETFTQQMTLRDTAELSIRTNLCEDQAHLIANAVTGYQKDNNFESYRPHFAGWDFIPNLQQNFQDPPAWNFSFDPFPVQSGEVSEPVVFDVITYGSADRPPVTGYIAEIRASLVNGTTVTGKSVLLKPE